MLQTPTQPAREQKEQGKASKETTYHPEEPSKIPLQPMQKLSPSPFTFTYYAEEKNTPATQGEAEQEGPIRTSDFRSETEIWRLMTSIMSSEHQEMMHLQEGARC